MQRILNKPDEVVEDMLQGITKAHPWLVRVESNPRVIKYSDAPIKGKVGLVSGGGSGHKPAFIGYIGHQLLDAVAVGEIFSSPSAKHFFDAFKAADGGAGVLCLYGNYSGDNMNVKMATKMASQIGLTVRTVVANDDVASAPIEQRNLRRGVAGEVLMWKVAGAAAALNYQLDDIATIAQKAIDNTRSVGIGLTSCVIPALGQENFTIEPGTMEVGIGHHGEPGIRVESLKTASEMAQQMTAIVLPDLPFSSGDEVTVLVSGLGGTPVMELYIFHNEVTRILESKGIKVFHSYVGNYFTSLEMRGVSLTLMKMDATLKPLIELACNSIGMSQPGGAL